MKAINLKVGDVIVYEGGEVSRVNSEGAVIATMRNGDELKVIEVHAPRRGVGVLTDTDGEEVEDPDRDGHVTVEHAEWGRRLAWPDDEGRTWRRK